MATVGSVTGIYDTSAATPLTLSRPDLFAVGIVVPEAALVTYFQVNQGGGDYNTPANGISYGYGAVARVLGGDRAWALGIQVTDDVATTDTARAIKYGRAIVLPEDGPANTYNAEMTAVLTDDGITFTSAGTWGATGDIVIEVTLIGGSDFDAWIPASLRTTTSISSNIPFLPNLAMYGQARAADDDPGAQGALSQGFVFDNGVDAADQRTRMVYYREGQAAEHGSSMIRNDCFSGTLFQSTFANKMEHIDFASDGGSAYEHNFSTSSPDSFDGWGAMYMRFDNEDVSLEDITLPRSTGTFTKDDYGFTPAVTKVWSDSSVQAYNTAYDNIDRAGCPFEWTIEGSGNSVALYQDNGSSPTDNSARMVLGGLDSVGVPEADGYRGDTAQRIEGGFSAEFSQVSDVAIKSFSLALGTASESDALNATMGSTQVPTAYFGDTQVTAAYFGTESLGGSGGLWTRLYSDSPADDADDWTKTLTTLTNETGGMQYTQTSAGLASVTLDKTVVAGKDYRVTIGLGTVSTPPTLALQSGAVESLTPLHTGASDTEVVMTAKALDTTLTVAILTVANGATVFIESVLIEELA